MRRKIAHAWFCAVVALTLLFIDGCGSGRAYAQTTGMTFPPFDIENLLIYSPLSMDSNPLTGNPNNLTYLSPFVLSNLQLNAGFQRNLQAIGAFMMLRKPKFSYEKMLRLHQTQYLPDQFGVLLGGAIFFDNYSLGGGWFFTPARWCYMLSDIRNCSSMTIYGAAQTLTGAASPQALAVGAGIELQHDTQITPHVEARIVIKGAFQKVTDPASNRPQNLAVLGTRASIVESFEGHQVTQYVSVDFGNQSLISPSPFRGYIDNSMHARLESGVMYGTQCRHGVRFHFGLGINNVVPENHVGLSFKTGLSFCPTDEHSWSKSIQSVNPVSMPSLERAGTDVDPEIAKKIAMGGPLDETAVRARKRGKLQYELTRILLAMDLMCLTDIDQKLKEQEIDRFISKFVEKLRSDCQESCHSVARSVENTYSQFVKSSQFMNVQIKCKLANSLFAPAIRYPEDPRVFDNYLNIATKDPKYHNSPQAAQLHYAKTVSLISNEIFRYKDTNKQTKPELAAARNQVMDALQDTLTILVRSEVDIDLRTPGKATGHTIGSKVKIEGIPEGMKADKDADMLLMQTVVHELIHARRNEGKLASPADSLFSEIEAWIKDQLIEKMDGYPYTHGMDYIHKYGTYGFVYEIVVKKLLKNDNYKFTWKGVKFSDKHINKFREFLGVFLLAGAPARDKSGRLETVIEWAKEAKVPLTRKEQMVTAEDYARIWSILASPQKSLRCSKSSSCEIQTRAPISDSLR